MIKRVLLYGADGKPMRVLTGEPSWPASGSGRRAAQWNPTASSINSLLSNNVTLLRNRARDELRRNAWAKSAMDSFAANAVGTGIRPTPRTETEDFRAALLDAWEEFVETCDADGTVDFYGMQELVCRAEREGGDCFVRLRNRRASFGLPIPLQLQVLEAELVDSTFNRALRNGRTIKGGIEFDRFGRRLAYHFYKAHPGEQMGLGFSSQRIRIPASQVIHVFRVLRPGQVRGMPSLATILALLKEVEDANGAYVLRQKIRNLYVTFEEVPVPESASVLDDTANDATETDDVEVVAPQPGTHVLLPPGHKVSHSSPPTDAEDFAAFMKTQLRGIAAGSGATYEAVTGDLTDVNFSSIRAGLIEFRRRIQQYQRNVLVFQLCRPVWRKFLVVATLIGKLKIPAAETLSRLLRPKWTPTPGWEYVDPEKEVKAIVRAIRAGLLSPSAAVAMYGFDAEELHREAAADFERMKKLGLVLDSDPSTDTDGSARAGAVGGTGDGGTAGQTS